MMYFHELSSEEVQDWVVRFIGTVDYDIEKEVVWNLENRGEDTLYDEMCNTIESFMVFLKNRHAQGL